MDVGFGQGLQYPPEQDLVHFWASGYLSLKTMNLPGRWDISVIFCYFWVFATLTVDTISIVSSSEESIGPFVRVACEWIRHHYVCELQGAKCGHIVPGMMRALCAECEASRLCGHRGTGLMIGSLHSVSLLVSEYIKPICVHKKCICTCNYLKNIWDCRSQMIMESA